MNEKFSFLNRHLNCIISYEIEVYVDWIVYSFLSICSITSHFEMRLNGDERSNEERTDATVNEK